MHSTRKNPILIGWASADITPSRPVSLRGQFHARISEGVMDPVTVTALALSSLGDDGTEEQAVMVSCDVVVIPDELRDGVREELRARVPGLDAMKVFLNATHTHTAPAMVQDVWEAEWGVIPDLMTASEYREFMIGRIFDAVESAWNNKKPGGIGYGLGQAVVGHCRRCVYEGNKSQMYGETNDPSFRHIEGYEDHGVNLLFTWDAEKRLTGMVINLACPSQVSEAMFQISADFWHDTRKEIRKRHGDHLFFLPQASPAGDQSPHRLWRKAAEDRMQKLAGRNKRAEVAHRIANAVDEVLPLVEPTMMFEVPFAHSVETIQLSRRLITEKDVEAAQAQAAEHRRYYEEEIKKLKADPSLKKHPRWYWRMTAERRGMSWNEGVAERFELQKTEPTIPMELHVIRLGDVAFASNRFELYLDFGIRIKAQSRATLDFLIQLAGPGTYLSTQRSVDGGGYGSVAASALVGPEGGQELVEATVGRINAFWPDSERD